ncbi:MAG: hypothetical protein GY899_12620 [Verrucomicrobiaceae bacterium]|nr:hypothetical protein [Verrucomicrobiaceae bacterium]
MSEEGSAKEESAGSSLAPRIIKLLIAGLVLSIGFLCLVASRTGAPEVATVKMVCGLIVLWIVLGGALMHYFRDSVRQFILGVPLEWRVKFTLFATLLALVEEAIAVLMTNLAPLLGVEKGEAYLTASTNYLDVVLFHSVVVFIPLFIALAVLLTRYDFSPFAVFLLFGITGILCEATINPAGAFFGIAQWIFIYGLMVYLPAYCLPQGRGARPVEWYHYVFSVPAVFLIALPLLIPIIYLIGHILKHPSGAHF